VCDRPDKLAVLDDGRARHECVQVGTTHFNGKFTLFSCFLAFFNEKYM
jgi:hypothetical protein